MGLPANVALNPLQGTSILVRFDLCPDGNATVSGIIRVRRQEYVCNQLAKNEARTILCIEANGGATGREAFTVAAELAQENTWGGYL